jgi:anti-sigma factor RsiW
MESLKIKVKKMKQEQCKFSHKLNAYIDAELSKKEFEKVQAHLKHCHLCQKELRELMKVNSFLQNYQEEEVAESIINKILDKTDQMNLNPQRLRFKQRVISLSVAASILISFATGVLVSNLTFSQDTETTRFELGQSTLYSYFDGGE